MIKLFNHTGPFAWPLLILAAVVVVLSIRDTLGLFGNKEDERRKAESTNAILFWGCISVVMGFFGHYMGMYGAMQAISRAGGVAPGILAGGYGEALLPLLMGMFIFIFSALAWFVLRWRYRKLVEGS